MKYINSLAILALLAITTALSAQTSNPTVRFHTNVGDMDVTLLKDSAPLTVANFLNYVNKGAYTNTLFHRSVPGFVIQGGGYQLQNHAIATIPQDPPVQNEFHVSNTRGTLAMAKLGNDPNSATDQWFFNTVDNASLDSNNGGFTVFGKIANDASLAVMDKIAAVPVVYRFASPFNEIPLINYTNGVPQDSSYVLVTAIDQPPVPSISADGIKDAASFASNASAGVSPGELITIFGQQLGPAQLATLTLDSSGAVSTSLAGTRVLFDGAPGPMIYTSAGQISAVAPYNLAGKSSVNVVVEYQGAQTSSVQVAVASANPGIFTLNSSGKGDGSIVRTDGSIVNSANPARTGDVLVLFGEGYGMAAPALADGAVVGSTWPLPVAKFVLLIDGQPVDALYAGGAPGIVNGVLQVNFRVPQLAAGSHSIQLQVGDRQSPSGVTLQTR